MRSITTNKPYEYTTTPDAGELSLTLRGRIIASMAAIATLTYGVSTAIDEATPDFRPDGYRTYTVNYNDTLWGIAREEVPHSGLTTGEVVSDIEAHPANQDALDGFINPGDTLVLPNDYTDVE